LGARLAVFNELKPGEKLKLSEVQLLTGGDSVSANVGKFGSLERSVDRG
jgi:hypothetical protein